MPRATRELSPHSRETERPGRGGAGGVGLGPRVSTTGVSIDDSVKIEIPDVDMAAFCTEYHLSATICKVFKENGFDTLNEFLQLDEAALQALDFKMGQYAELRWAVKKLFLQRFPQVSITSTEGKYTPSIYGGEGGAGGDGLQRGGQGGTGEPPQIGKEDVYLFSVIGGGIGGAGGAGGLVLGLVGKSAAAAKPAANGGTPSPQQGPVLNGGQGGPGGPGAQEGGVGGLGGAPQISITDVALFKRITGGVGGAGGASDIQGGRGGIGQGPKPAKLLASIDNETRLQAPHMKLEAFGIKPEVRQLLKDEGFQSVGALFEVYDTDFPAPPFKIGHIASLKLALKKFIAHSI
ncbi:hypothetical protein K438DRAFT_281678 [Mycena galopus ATCC 62051]|nr:hypothetical protein K438DRAFT_281678 [Mycena galopus ATCC 62051]